MTLEDTLAVLSAADLDGMVRSLDFAHLADWLMAYVVKEHPEKEMVRRRASAS